MRYVYFTKLLKPLDLPGIIGFLKEAGLDGADFTVRPGYPVTPENVTTELPRAVKMFKDEGLIIGLVTASTDMIDPADRSAQAIFEACGKAGIPAIKIGYLPYKGSFEKDLADGRRRLEGFAKLAEKTKVRACYHTHSGSNLGGACAAMRLLLTDLDPHHVGAFVDTGHCALNGGPLRLEFDMVREWLTLIAIKDIVWVKGKDGWRFEVAPAGEGIVKWSEFAAAVKDRSFNGTISLHGEYETKDLAERKKLAIGELAFLKKLLGGGK